MAMANARDEYQRHLLQAVHSLSDLELAALLCLIAREHCLISTVPDSVDELADELRLVATKTFNLRPVVVNCHSHTTLDDFATALLIHSPHSSPVTGQNSNDPRSVSPFRSRQNDSQQQQQPQTGSYFFQPSRTAPSNAGLRGGGGGNLPMSLTGQSYSTTSHQQQSPQQQPQIANIILAKHLDRAPKAVQIQALELLRTRRIFTRTSVQPAPKQFLFIALVGAARGGQARVTRHLNDFFYISHWHDPEESGFPHLDGEYGDEEEAAADSSDPDIYDNDEDKASIDSGSSVVKKTPLIPSSSAGGGFSPSLSSSSLKRRPDVNPNHDQKPVLAEGDIAHLAQQSQKVRIDIDVVRYQMNIIAFLRMHRAVGGGVSPFATKHFDQLVKSLAPLHGVDYVTPSLVALAVKKIYLHRLELVEDPHRERSMQWGSELPAVEALLGEVDAEGVIDDVLGMVGVPS